MLNWLKAFAVKIYKNIEDQAAKYVASLIIVTFLILLLPLKNWTFSKHTLTLHGWAWLLIILIGLLIFPAIRVLLRRKLSYYTRDEIFGLIWEWDDLQESISDDYFGLTPLCPKCSYELKYDIIRGSPSYICENCSFSSDMIFTDLNGEIIYDNQQITRRVYREMERRVESGDYKKAKKRIKVLRKKIEDS